MSYDAGLHGLGQRYFLQALKLAESSGDRLLGASIVDAMSHQATFLGRFKEAANLARAARMGTATAGSPSAAAHFYATKVLADSYLDQGGAEKATEVALDALRIGEHLKSARCGAYVGEFRNRLQKVGKTREVTDFLEQAAITKLRTAQGARAVRHTKSGRIFIGRDTAMG